MKENKEAKIKENKKIKAESLDDEDGVLIRKIKMDCPICDKHHELEIRERNAKVYYKNKSAIYREQFYFCKNASPDYSQFADGKMVNENLARAKEAKEKLKEE